MFKFARSSSSRQAVAGLSLFGALLCHSAWALPPAEPAPPAAAAAAPGAVVLNQAPAAQGSVDRLLINPYGEVDGLLMRDRTVVKLAPHLSAAVVAAVAPGQVVRVFGLVEPGRSVKADALLNLATGQVVIDRPPGIDSAAPLPPHLRAAQLRQLDVEGRVDLVLTGPRGEVNGVILDNGGIVRFAPDGLRSPLQQGMPFAATGLGTRNAYGTAIEAISTGASLGTQQQIQEPLR
ncbi:hypothetical protein [Herbaspirillum sp. YR522]|uniref:hypothetical protein n=1 Tax=Herbaspirillum sp. YR522 TaxID=1144342 RepID=UPI00026F9190|nr:hypothetical protein [Herbaspirillum sp. YR522]EJM96307.1 hypothetical protein PMI40_04706 [Herbaspirillum sp. YR522]